MTTTYAPAPGSDADFDRIMTSVGEALAADPEAAKYPEATRREVIARALATHGKRTFVTDGLGFPMPDEPEPEDEPQIVQGTELTIPAGTPEPYWYEDPEQGRVIEHFVLMRRALGPAFHGGLLIAGAAGYGKTLMVPHIVERMNRERGLDLSVYKMDCATTTDPQKWFGRNVIDKDGLRYERSAFVGAVESGMIVQLDELNRIHPHVSDSVHALLDATQSVSLSDLNLQVNVHPATVFIATMNIGAQYGGTFRLDHAFRSRFGTTIEVGPPPREAEIRILATNTGCDEDAAATLVDIADKSRAMFATGDLRVEISTRDLVAAGRWVAAGMTERQALAITAIPLFDGDAGGGIGAESDRTKIMAVVDGRLRR